MKNLPISRPRHLFAEVKRLGYYKRIDREVMVWGLKQIGEGQYAGNIVPVMIDRQRNGW